MELFKEIRFSSSPGANAYGVGIVFSGTREELPEVWQCREFCSSFNRECDEASLQCRCRQGYVNRDGECLPYAEDEELDVKQSKGEVFSFAVSLQLPYFLCSFTDGKGGKGLLLAV